MAMYSKRTMGYKLGMFAFVVGLAAFVTGFATSYWATFEFSIGSPVVPPRSSPSPSPSPSPSSPPSRPGWVWTRVEGHTGLWTVCVTVGSRCEGVSTSSLEWMLAVKVVECCAVGVLGLALLFFYFTNCVARKAAFTRLLEAGAALGGLLGLAGPGIYMWRSLKEDDILASMQEELQQQLGLGQGLGQGSTQLDVSMGWSFYLSVGGSVTVLAAAVAIFAFNLPPKKRSKDTRQRSRGSRGAVARNTTLRPTTDTHASSSMTQGYQPSGSSPYIISEAMAKDVPRIYPSLADIGEEE